MHFFIVMLFVTFLDSYAQDFMIIKSPADSLREVGDLKGALNEYYRCYSNDPTDKINIYNYACTLSKTKQYDSCFKYLHLAIKLDTVFNALYDPDFISLKKDKRWADFENTLINMLEIKTKIHIKDIVYAKKLWKMTALDQAYYSEIRLAENKIGESSNVVSALWDLKEMINDKNQKELKILIHQKGWPKISMVGSRASATAFLIIQHSDIKKQKIYLPIIKKLCEMKEASWQDYALMYDRIQVGQNKPQKYGSQLRFNKKTNSYELFPLENEEKVDEWRMSIGLETLSEYLSMWGLKVEQKKQ